ncbi:helix-turn-helix domain-containing protein [Streptomyces sp. RFCAC02]|uniref:ArsR/SmtB family transcription factor n=1 Tax=Streptomyces sp. RFCAC02 TaxID=2499143 RepID=UPI001021BB2D|nr:helix-turn-helix domain-containing protein [Streptomyces sp. RFCAC02]
MPRPETDPETGPPAREKVSDPAALKALAHPLRLRILRHLGAAGPATSTTLAAVLGENTGTLSYHLRQLAAGGFIEDVPERASGRERWWRTVRGRDVRRPAPSELTPAEQAVADTLDRLRMADDMRLAERFISGTDAAEGWARGSRGLSHLTREELNDFHDAYLELLSRFSRGPEEAAPGARPIALRWFGVPAD